jgi:polyhydroxyalkanoate synthesis regulator phasin
MTEISQILRKVALFGIGTVALSQEKIEAFVQEMVKDGELNKEEGKKFVLELLAEKEKQCKNIEEKINNKVKDAVERCGTAKKEDLEKLSTRMEKLETSIERLKQI